MRIILNDLVWFVGGGVWGCAFAELARLFRKPKNRT